MSRALLAKDLRANAGLAAALVLASVGLAASAFFSSLTADAPSLFDGIRGALRALAPIVAWLAADRLFVLEHRSKTMELLVSLPVPLVRIALSKLALSLAAVLALMLGLVLGAAAVASIAEYVDPHLCAVAAAQVAGYSTLWWGLACIGAQLGRYLASAVTVLLTWWLVGVALDWPSAAQPFSGALGVAFGAANVAPPWLVIAGSIVVGCGAAALAVVMFVRHGGAFVRDLHERRETSVNILAFVLASAVMSFIPSKGATLEDAGASSDGLTAVGRIVRAGGAPGARVHTLAKSLDDALSALEAELDLEPFTPMAVLPAFRPMTTPVERLWSFDIEAYGLELARPDDELLSGLLAEILAARTFSEISRARGWVAAGFPEYWLERRGNIRPERAEVLRARAEHAARQLADLSLAFPTDWPELERVVGVPLAAVLAREGLEVLRARCGDEVVRGIAREVFGTARARARWGRAVERMTRSAARDVSECGPEAQWLDAAWRERLADLASSSPRVWGTVPLPHVRPVRTARPDAFELAVPSSGLPVGAELWWREVDPLLAPGALEDPRRGELRSIALDRAQSVTRVSLPLDPRRHAMATIAFWSAPLALWLTTPWQDVSVR